MDEQGQGQCEAYSECENDPGPYGVCGVHEDEYFRRHPDKAPEGWHRNAKPNPADLTLAQLNSELGLKAFLTGGSEVVSRNALGEANAAHIAAKDNGGR